MPTPSPPDPLATRARATSEVNAEIPAHSHAVHALRSLAPLSLLSPLSALTAVTAVTVTVGHHHPERFVLLHCGVPRYAPLAALALVPIGSQRHTAKNAPLTAHRPLTATTRHRHFKQLRATGRSPSARRCRRRRNIPACRVRCPRIKPQTDTSHRPAPRDLRSRSPPNSNLDHRRTRTGPSERCRSTGVDPGLQLRNHSSEPKGSAERPRWGAPEARHTLRSVDEKSQNRAHVSQMTRCHVAGKLRFSVLLRCAQLFSTGNSLVHEGTPRKSGSCFVRRADLGSYRLATRVWINRDILIIWNVCAPPACAPGVRPSPKPEAVAPSPGKEQTPETPVEARTHPTVV